MLLPPVEPPSPRDMAFAVLDLETTGGTPRGGWSRQGRYHPPSEITEVGVVQVSGTVIQGRWERLAAIEGPLPAAIQRLTGITLPMLAGAPSWDAVALELMPVLEGRVWVAHHAPFDGAFLKAWLPEGFWKRHTLLCSRLLAKVLVPEAEHRSLASLCGLLGIHNRRAHRALADAEATTELLQILIHRAEQQGIDGSAFLDTGRVDWKSLK